MKNPKKAKIGGKTICTGKLYGFDMMILHSGIGKVNAAASSAGIIERYSASRIINIGVGGAYPGSGLNVGDIAVATKEVFGDEGVVTKTGWDSMKKIGIPVVTIGRKTYFNEFPLDSKMSRLAVSLVRQSLVNGAKVKSGSFVTVSSTSGTNKRAVELGRRFGAMCENMEGAAIAQVCAVYGIPMLEVRGISNIAGIRDKRKWDIETASENCQRAVLEVLKYYLEQVNKKNSG